jgi:hypothetical protein
MNTINPDEIQPDSVVAMVAELQRHPGFKMVNHYFEKKKAELVDAILNVDRSDSETHDLKQQLKALTQVSPEIAAQMISSKASKRLKDYTKQSTQ